jgi:hypothetical protein
MWRVEGGHRSATLTLDGAGEPPEQPAFRPCEWMMSGRIGATCRDTAKTPGKSAGPIDRGMGSRTDPSSRIGASAAIRSASKRPAIKRIADEADPVPRRALRRRKVGNMPEYAANRAANDMDDGKRTGHGPGSPSR